MKISIIFGTRPEIIKLAILIKKLSVMDNVNVDVCFTGQHKEMVLPLIDFFEIKINSHLNLMQPDQTLASLTSTAIDKIDKYIREAQPDIVFVQGDTTTASCAATAAFYNRKKVAHVEAGLRTGKISEPFPEEFNRRTISIIADIHYAPTETAKTNLLKEGVEQDDVLVTGNTVIDALEFTVEKVKNNPGYKLDLKIKEGKIVLITSHRRENFGQGFENICSAIKKLSEKYPDFGFVYPVHLNPNVQQTAYRLLAGLPNVYLIAPLDYISFAQIMSEAYLILTDSGGIQEEAPTLGKPVLVMRDTTERPEAIEAGTSKLVGTNEQAIINNVSLLIENKNEYEKMSKFSNPYGDGQAAQRIVDHILA